MIDEIVIRNVATYDSDGVKLSNLGKVNYFYGSNGSGKTTISEVLRNSSSHAKPPLIVRKICYPA
ncbi:AAA family ATPase [Virgibacillus salinus]|uniref:AAA domain-containing protein n=1 Tax=Virgibacillus salinus TaxID=553311 RepID=A0A1H0ZHM3_9BACI|nr:AAA family ATPase [Virgibacillus salinus]SDQ26968.1 AAA domain-containing protein [Virgibacillus salinus]